MSNPEATTPPLFDPVQIFAALGDETRLQLVARLGDGRERSISQLKEGLPLTRQGLTKHLRVLEEAGILRSHRVGRETRFAYLPDSIGSARDCLEDISRQWDEALARLKSLVES